MENKTLVIKRLAIFYVIALLPVIITVIAVNSACGGYIYESSDPGSVTTVFIMGTLLMLVPAIANIVTRLITKEGFGDNYLGFTACKGNMRYYVLSVVLKPVEAIVGMFLLYLIFLNKTNLTDAFSDDISLTSVSSVLMLVSYSVIIFFPAFGEEWGWRGYMMPKLLKIMPKPAAIIVGGILQGLWCAPLTVSGHNFGTKYPMYPWLGILVMCGIGIAMNAVLTLLTERTKSIYPASFCRMIGNNLSAVVMAQLLLGEPALMQLMTEVSKFDIALVTLLPGVITGIVCFVLFIMKKDKTSK